MKKVLIVDDASFMRMAIKTMLEKEGFEIVAEAEDGIDAVEKYIKYKPDVVTMDITMPKMSGIEALKQIKKHDKQAKVVMVSAMGQENLVRESIISGAKTFIVKPFKSEQVVDTIKQIANM